MHHEEAAYDRTCRHEVLDPDGLEAAKHSDKRLELHPLPQA